MNLEAWRGGPTVPGPNPADLLRMATVDATHPATSAGALKALLRDLTAGLLVGLLVITATVAYGALIFSGELSPFIPNGVGLALASSAIACLVVALLTSRPGMTASVQNAPAAVMGVLAASVSASVPAGADPTVRFITVVAALALTTLAAGVVFLSLGQFRLGKVVRYLPYPVVGGFLAGTGWLLVVGSLGVMGGERPTLDGLPELLQPTALRTHVPGLVFGALLFLATRRVRHHLMFPVGIAVGVAAFYVTMLASGGTMPAWREAGLLFQPFLTSDLLRPVAPAQVTQIHWPALIANVASAATVVLVSLLALLLNVSGIEVLVRRRLDFNRELRAAGVANLASGAFGGMVGFQGLVYNVLAFRLAPGRRLVALTVVALLLATIAFGSGLLGFIPVPVIGGVLVYLGLGFVADWVFAAARSLTRMEHAIVLLILAVMAGFGLLPGVAVGLVLALALFVVSYGRVDAVKHVLTGSSARSRMRWDPLEDRVLADTDDCRLVLHLHGYLFFGTAHAVMERVEAHLAGAPVTDLVLDFREVTGIDATALTGLVSLVRLAESKGLQIVFSDVSPELRRTLARRGLRPGASAVLSFAPSLDHALEACERRALERTPPPDAPLTPAESDPLALAAEGDPDVRDLLRRCDRLDLPPGHRLIEQGDAPDSVYLLASGQVTARLDREGREPLRLETMRGGSLVGEVGFYTGAPRSATVVTDEATTVYRLTRQRLETLSAEEPRLAASFHRLASRRMADRVAHLTRVAEALQR
jgi:sulfate permease, SulP family